jgi:predicted SnoaL-like aldol condensation-catalyzing enzyme
MNLRTLLLLLLFSGCCTTNDRRAERTNMPADDLLLKAFETGDVTQLDNIIAPDFINHAGGDQTGAGNLKTMIRGFHNMMGPVEMKILKRWVDGDDICDWVRFSGGSPWQVIEGMEVTRYENGKAAEHWFFPGSQNKNQ